MRLKTFTAANHAEALNRVRAELGYDAIIVATAGGDGQNEVTITAAVETEATDPTTLPAGAAAVGPHSIMAGAVRDILDFHRVPDSLGAALATNAASAASTVGAAPAAGVQAPGDALVAALAQRFDFDPLPRDAAARPIMLVGPPGCGKTLVAAKLATRALLARRTATVISTDTARAGGTEQLATFCDILRLPLLKADNAATLERVVAGCADRNFVIIDSAGANPHARTDLTLLGDLVAAAEAEPILVLAAGGDAEEAADMARAFAGLGVRRMILSRVDAARRLGGALAAAASGLAFAEMGDNPCVGYGLAPLDAGTLGALLMPQAATATTEMDDVDLLEVV